MKQFVSAAALAAALALPGMPLVAQQTTTETETQETTTQGTTTGTQQTEAAPGDFKVLSSADDLAGLEPEEVRIENVDEAPRDHVQAISSSLDPSNAEAMELREQISGMDEVQQALTDADVEEERVVGGAIEDGALILYVLPEG